MLQDDFNWMADNGTELYAKYAGKWIAVRDRQIVGVGETATEAAEQAEKQVPDGKFLLEALDASLDVIYGRA